jgi:energy-coupling factor transporter ATP-binding protein EcfA2
MGFGLRNALQIMTTICAAPPGAILFIDEPEQGINQSKQRDLASIIEDLRSDITVVIATQAEAFCRGLSKSALYLAEMKNGKAELSAVDVGDHAHRKRLAKSMGINPLYLHEGGKILFVEGPSDRLILEDWIRLNLGELCNRVEIQELGGCGKIGEKFARPMFVSFRDSIFFLLDSDGSSSASPIGDGIRERLKWFTDHDITQYVVLRRREIENYVGCAAIAKIANVNLDRVRPTPGHEDFFDIDQAFKRESGSFDKRRISVEAYRSLDSQQRRLLFDDENEALVARLRAFLQD